MTDNTLSGSDIDVTHKDTPTEVEADKIKDTQAEQSAKIAHTSQAELDHFVDVHEMVTDTNQAKTNISSGTSTWTQDKTWHKRFIAWRSLPWYKRIFRRFK